MMLPNRPLTQRLLSKGASSLLMCSLLLGLVGCGCNDDSSLTTIPFASPAVMGMRSIIPPAKLNPPEEPTEALRIDITFLLDDSDSMNASRLGIIPDNDEFDERIRTNAVQAIMEQLEQTVRARLEAEWLADGITQDEMPDIDFAFAVARYEDFGGSFTNPNRALGDVDLDLVDGNNPENDMDARPFILNMPILRQSHPQFASRFAAALTRTAPGDGNPRYVLGSTRIAMSDAQSGIEALWQIAAPTGQDGVIGGFDADGDNSTLGSGAPTSLTAARNPQTKPGGTGDVPAVAFELLTDPDADGQDVYAVTGEDKTQITIPNPAGGSDILSISSGNLGGVGWRENSARFVVLATDIATVAPTETAPDGVKEPLAVLPPPADAALVSSVAGTLTPLADPRNAPRGARDVLLGAFDSGFQLVGGNNADVVPRRIGVANGPIHLGGNGVAPVGAHTVQETIARLNELDIEVLCMGTPFRGGLDTKPGDTGVNGDKDSDIGTDDFNPSDPDVTQPDMAPWFWFNAVTRLTMPPITSVPLGGGEALFPAVYNLATVWPLQFDDFDGSNKTGIKHTVTDDLIERIRDWVDGPTPYLTPGAGTGSTAARVASLPTLDWLLTLDIFPPEDSDVIQAAPTEAGVPKTHFETTLSVATYYSDEARPANVNLTVPSFSFVAKDDTVPLPATMLLPFKISAKFIDFGNVTPENQAVVDAIIAYIKDRGDGDVDLADEHDLFIQAEGTVLITVRAPSDNGPTAQLVTFDRGSIRIQDLAVGRDSSDQIGGSGQAFPPDPIDAP